MKKDRFIKNIIIAAFFFSVLWFGLIPLLTGTSFKDYIQQQYNGKYEFGQDEFAVIVVGSEPEGIAAAVSCARTGLKTLIVTEDTDLGGYIEDSLILEMKPDEGIINKKKYILNNGIYEEIFGKLKVGFTAGDYKSSVKNLISKEKSLSVIYNSAITDIAMEQGTVEGIYISSEDGKRFLKAGVFIDATQVGTLLELCGVPYTKGSEDINVPDSYMPLEFNFMISGVKWKDINEIQKTSDFILEFRNHLMMYERSHKRTKIVSPSFIKQSEDELVITGLRQWRVDVDEPEDLEAAYRDAMDEALMLTAYMKSELIPFADCTFRMAPKELYIPEYRHYEGRYLLTVADILSNRNFKTKIALASSPIDAGKFVDNGYNYVVADPDVYSIPLESIVPVNVDNVLMVGPKASFKSLAATSAGAIPTSITVGEAAGLTGAYCFINNKNPGELINMTDFPGDYESFLKRGGIFLMEFSEKLKNHNDNMILDSNWAYRYIVELSEYGLISGGANNDFRLDSESSQDVFAILLKNAVVKIAPESYSLNMDMKFGKYEKTDPLTGESACALILDILEKPYEKGKAYESAQMLGLIPGEAADKFTKSGGITMDVVYCLAVETANLFIK